ncbi:MAG: serine hydrolase [Verrucomicrobia bacterium]|nr:serine hydrolase [Verrucomicrobiota bacterium]
MKLHATIVCFLFGLASLHAADAPGPLAPVLQSLVDKRIAPGVVVLVADKEKVLDLEAVGYASLDAKTPMRTDCLFWIASMTKTFTAAALMMMVDEDKVNVSDPVEKYLPEFKGQMIAGNDKTLAHPPKHPITITDILTHTSGLVLANEKTLKKEYSLATNVMHIAALPLRHEPGTQFAYNNCGINTAGRIIEVVSGISYADFVQHRLFDPLGMKDTTFWPTEEQAGRLARTAKRAADKQSLEEIHHEKGLTPALIEKLGHGVKVPAQILADMGGNMISNYANRYGEPAGGLFSTARDVGRFCQMVLNGGMHEGRHLLSERAIKEMTSIHTGSVPVNPQEAWGLGWAVKIRDDEGPSVGSFGHRGARRTAMWVDPKHQFAMVILVERFDMTGTEQKEFYGSFMKAAIEKYGKAR